MARFGSNVQLRLFDEGPAPLGMEGTFRPNREAGVHRWYPYLEGFSHGFVASLIDAFGPAAGPITLYEPFAGSGTTPAVAAWRGDACVYSEVNPFMRLVVEAKTDAVRDAFPARAGLRSYFAAVAADAQDALPTASEAMRAFGEAFGSRPYFGERQLREVVALKAAVARIDPPHPAFAALARLALGAIVVGSSTLKRAGDLRYRTAREQLPPDHSPIAAFAVQAAAMDADLQALSPPTGAVRLLAPSALDPVGEHDFADLVVTSPPYLNGTNYIRNAKLELWVAGFIRSEKELAGFRRETLTAGICDVVANGREVRRFDMVEKVATRLDAAAYDRRIPQMVRRYFSDTDRWLGNVAAALKPGARAVIDIGDSRFAGVHVPTDRCLAAIAEAAGLTPVEERFVRARKSKDGSPLKQVLLVFEKPPRARTPRRPRRGEASAFRRAAEDFAAALPHRAAPHASRNWGDPLHSLCSYQGKLKPAIAHFLVRDFTAPGDRVLDPLSGAGTIPLEATLQGREAIANDLQELGYLLSAAKVTAGGSGDVWAEYTLLGELIAGGTPDGADPDWGFNGTIRDYFHEDTLREILIARRHLRASLAEGLTWQRAFVLACFAHLLHGNRPYALSRRSHPVTPLKPQGPFEYRPAMPRLKEKIARALGTRPEVAAGGGGAAHLGDFRALSLARPVDAIITSPPFRNSTRFDVANWMRLWFCGWTAADFQARRPDFLETQQKRSMAVYADFLDACASWLRPGGRLILHLGRVKGFDMAAEIGSLVPAGFDVVHSAEECVAGAERFGLSDQGATDAHQYLFLLRR